MLISCFLRPMLNDVKTLAETGQTHEKPAFRGKYDPKSCGSITHIKSTFIPFWCMALAGERLNKIKLKKHFCMPALIKLQGSKKQLRLLAIRSLLCACQTSRERHPASTAAETFTASAVGKGG